MSLNVQHALQCLLQVLNVAGFSHLDSEYHIAEVSQVRRYTEVLCAVELAGGIWKSNSECKGLHSVLEVCLW